MFSGWLVISKMKLTSTGIRTQNNETKETPHALPQSLHFRDRATAVKSMSAELIVALPQFGQLYINLPVRFVLKEEVFSQSSIIQFNYRCFKVNLLYVQFWLISAE